MNLREINFSFGGPHCLRDFGCIYVEAGGHIITPPVAPNTYEIAGMSGTIAMPGATRKPFSFSGTLHFQRDPPDQATAQEMLRRIGAWLLNGRQWLVFDYEPQRYYLAEVTGSTKWDYSKWIEGGLAVEFTAQPYAYNTRESAVTANTTGTSASLALPLDTVEDAPLRAVIQNTGAAAITAATIVAHGKSAAFSGMSLGAGGTLTLDMEPPIGAVFASGGSALSYATTFDYIELTAGLNTVAVTLQYGSGTRGARITVSARGRA